MTISALGPVVTGANKGPAAAFEYAEGLSRAGPPDEGLAQAMYLQGSALIYANCNAYFDDASRLQTRLIFTRDAVGAISAVATSTLALAKASKTALAAVGLTTTAAYSGIDLVTKDYLFSADNVEAVRTLTDNALATHSKAVLASTRDQGPAILRQQWSYDFAAKQLFDEQAMCTLRSIAALARDAIQNGHLVATSNTLDNDESKLAQAQDRFVLQSLGAIFKTPGALTMDEAVALWWLLNDRAGSTEYPTIAAVLKNLPAGTNPFDAKGGLVPDWSLGPQAVQAMSGFSDGTAAAFETQIAAGRAKIAAASTPGKAAIAMTVTLPPIARAPIAGSDHIQVRAR